MYFIMIAYLTCVVYNILSYKYLESKLFENIERIPIFYLFILSGPILSFYTIYRYICRKIKIYFYKRELKAAIQKELPQLLKQYKITAIEN